MIRSVLVQIANSPVLFFGSFFLLRACLWGAIETLWRARRVPYRQVAIKDFTAQLFHVFLVVPVVLFFYDRLFACYPLPRQLLDLPILIRITLYLVIADLGYYWAHRLMHTKTLWRTHKWHHFPSYMYWLAGGRATIPHQFLIQTPYILATPILEPAPWWIYTLVWIYTFIINDWTHLNVSWGARWLEWFIVTPRFHHIHHSSNPDHYNFNMGNVFTFWDRIFGTYLDPDTVDKNEIVFGIDDRPNALRLIAGI
jgi:sterol desaturase/sphingolipid hydroxylase (fatty acid hydroxylase superfamily)